MGRSTNNGTQKDRVLAYLEKHGTITQRQAYHELGIMRLASRINDLKNDGHDIRAVLIDVPGRNGRARVARYSFGALEG